MLLAIDTSTRQASIALYDPERGLLAEQSWFSANRHTEELMPAISGLLTSGGRGAPRPDIGGRGDRTRFLHRAARRPGRSQGAGAGTGLKLVGVPTLDVTAYPHQAQPVPVVAVAQAGRGRVYWAPYAHGPGGWGPQEPYALSTVIEMANTVVRPMAFAGELTEADRETLTALCRSAAGDPLVSRADGLRRAGYLAELAAKRLEMGQEDDPATLSPIYLQQPDGTQRINHNDAAVHFADGASRPGCHHAPRTAGLC